MEFFQRDKKLFKVSYIHGWMPLFCSYFTSKMMIAIHLFIHYEFLFSLAYLMVWYTWLINQWPVSKVKQDFGWITIAFCVKRKLCHFLVFCFRHIYPELNSRVIMTQRFNTIRNQEKSRI